MVAELWTTKREMAIKMGMIWMIQADIKNQSYDLPDWVGKTLHQ